jgi:murein L,D-transpeptidase YafK
MKRLFLWCAITLVLVGTIVFRDRLEAAVSIVKSRLEKNKTVAQRLEQYGSAARQRWQPLFASKQVTYPPARLVLVGLKTEKVLQVYGAAKDGPFQLLRAMPILAASGKVGPKLREGDKQVPEGLYQIESLNPNSRFHLSLRVNYPNSFDRAQAGQDGRTQLGGDIMIHGNAVSIGCLAMGNEGAEDLFVLAADTGLKNISVILSPIDFRRSSNFPDSAAQPPWTKELYYIIRQQLKDLPSE